MRTTGCSKKATHKTEQDDTTLEKAQMIIERQR